MPSRSLTTNSPGSSTSKTSLARAESTATKGMVKVRPMISTRSSTRATTRVRTRTKVSGPRSGDRRGPVCTFRVLGHVQ